MPPLPCHLEDIQSVAHLARLHLADPVSVQQDLERILAFVQQIETVPVVGVAPLSHPHASSQPRRPDVVTGTVDRAQLQGLAPAVEAGLYLVPPVIE